MKVEKNKVVSIHYTLKDDNGNVIDTSEGRDPLAYLHGNHNIILGLEEKLEGKKVGDKLHVDVSPEKGYGIVDEALKMVLKKEQFENSDKLQVGMQFQAQIGNNIAIYTITNIKDNDVFVDGNHPLAGMNLHFDVEIMDIRDATAEELEHGHAHMEGHSH